MSDEGDLERLYDAHAAALYAFGLHLTRDEGETRDLIQEVFVKLARNPGLLRDVTEPRSFLFRLLHNASIDRFRRRQTRQVHLEALAAEPAPVFAPTDDPDEQAFRDALAQGLLSLPPEQREVIHLKLWQGLTFDAIAEILGIPLNTAASRYRYGLDKLRQHLRPLYEELR